MGEIRVAEAKREKFIQVANAEKLKRDRHARSAVANRPCASPNWRRNRRSASRPPPSERDAQVKDAERAMRIALAEANAKAVAGENTAKAAIAAGPGRTAGQAGRSLPARRDPEARGRGRRCRKPRTGPWPRPRWPRPSASRPNAAPRSKPPPRPRRPRSSWTRKPRPKSAACEADRRGPGHLRQAGSRSQGPLRNPGQEGRRPQAHHRSLRRLAAGFPVAHARAPRHIGQTPPPGHLQHQVRQGCRLGRRRQGRHHGHFQFPAKLARACRP